MNADRSNANLPGGSEVRAALVNLLHLRRSTANVLLIAFSISRTGPALYVVMAWNEAERLIAKELEP
jgi:hypothetical protein